MSSELDFMAQLAERKIQEAIEEGAFDNLPGKGQPLKFDDDGLPFDVKMMNKILKNAGVLPEWMQMQQDLSAEIASVGKLRGQYVKENHKRHSKLTYLPADHPEIVRYSQWHARCRAKYLSSLKSVNNLLLKLSLTAPSTITIPGLYKIDAEMGQFDEEFPSLGAEQLAPAEEETTEGHTRSLIRDAYAGGASGSLKGGLLNTVKRQSTKS